MQLRIQFADGHSEEVTPAPVDLVKFERKFNMAAAAIEDDPRVEYLMFLAWASLRRQGKVTDDFDAFLESLADIDSEDDSLTPPPPPPA